MIDLLGHPLAPQADDDHPEPHRAVNPRPPTRPEQGDPRRAAFTASLRARYAVAEQRQDAKAKRALFKEAAYLGIRPDAYQG